MKDFSSEREALFALSFSSALSLKHIDLYYKSYQSYQQILNFSPSQFNQIELIKKNHVFEGKETLLKKAEQIKKQCQNHRIKWVTLIDSKYPPALKEIYLPPLVLYYLSDQELPGYYLGDKHKSYLAIVGTRRSDHFTNRFTEKVAYHFTRSKGHIISGLALGIDGYAHQGACRAHHSKKNLIGANTAVLACGVDYIYPYTNKNLFHKILAVGGVILSEYPPGTKPSPYRFPSRNRIISGLSEGVLVMQAPQKSGALITTQYALEQGRNVYAFDPRSMEMIPENFAGNLNLMEQGAVGIKDPEGFFNREGILAHHGITLPNDRLEHPQNSSTDPAKPDSNQLLTILKTPRSINELVPLLKINLIQLNSLLLENLIDGKIKELPGKKFYTA